jgi:hypothetical protein
LLCGLLFGIVKGFRLVANALNPYTVYSVKSTDTALRQAILAPDIPVIRIKPSRGWVSLNLGELWEYRELLYFLTWRDIKVRYKQTVLGAAWALIQPFFTMVVFSLFFGKLAKMPSDNLPYPIFAFAGLVPWTFFANGLANSSNSLISNANLIRKVFFPRLAIPISTILSGPRGLCSRVPASTGNDGLLRDRSHRQLYLFTILSVAGDCYGIGCRPLVNRLERRVQRCTLCRSFSHPILDVRFSNRILSPALV